MNNKRKYLLILCLILSGCAYIGQPRVLQCVKCGDVRGRVGGLLPDQRMWCPCGGRFVVRRSLTAQQWYECKKRGYVTLEDGVPVDTYDYKER